MTKSEFIYSADPGLLLGFHGCDRQVAEKIVLGRDNMRPSINRYDWLGSGVYFWQNNYERAYDFACQLAAAGKIKEPAVVGAVLCLDYCLDLLDKDSIDDVKNNWEKIIRLIGEGTLPRNVNPGHLAGSQDKLLRYLDCMVIEVAHTIAREDNDPPFDTVRCAFIEGQPIFPGASFMDKSHIQICVRNPNCIKGLFMPRLRQPWNGDIFHKEEATPAIAS
ncbi:hypothetical protein SAMN05444266_101725 [Chitinophaga jiangningensis]|uniref:Uncharacterized protein n=1 Tax=Chitinophaga jiangningensis TaxID=1419482 RepID=A0A1M6WQP9_9BACT|nr:hypothetical protein [Chitinophaga jiangningensis]SHK95964.1 hypothetical protein SAMN05444266_101725 [Chitinophaga jiangningensis]